MFNDEEAVRNYLKKKFRTNVVRSRMIVRYKENMVREYQRIVNSFLKMMKPVVAELVKKVKNGSYMRMDADEAGTMDDFFIRYGEELDQKIEEFGLNKKIEVVGIKAYNDCVKEWKRIVNTTLGINVFDDAVLGDLYTSTLQTWVSDNVNLIVTVPKDTLSALETIMRGAFVQGKRPESLIKDILHEYDISEWRARFWARDQMAKLTGDITRIQQEECGVRKYIWSTSQDQRVRDSHAALEGKEFSWDDPPVVDERTGRRCHPAQDYNCRCCAIPVFELDELTLGGDKDDD